MNNIAKAIKCILLLRDMDQKELAKRMNLSTTLVSFLLTGKNEINAGHRAKIEQALSVNWSDVVYLSTLLSHQGTEDKAFFDELYKTLRALEAGSKTKLN